jgi:hypothetical protein
MLETFLALLTAHLVSDFVLQWDAMVSRKRELRVLLTHVAIVGASAIILLGARTIPGAIAVTTIIATHLAIDYVKVRSKDNLLAFTADQVAHIAIVAAIAIVFPKLAAEGFWSLLPGDWQAVYYGLLVYLSGLIVAVPLGGIVIKKLINPLVPPALPAAPAKGKSKPAATDPVSLPNIGRYIGWLERALTVAFIAAKQPEGVGFLLAAKSVLRIGDLKDEHQRSHAEYIIIGTFLSFGWAIVSAYAASAAATYWLQTS